jgi:penicillin-binding protein 2
MRCIYRPHVLKEIHYSDGRNPKKIEAEVLHELSLKPETAALIHEAMRNVVNHPAGTGGLARVKDVPVAGKTGSAENPQGEKTHALFIAFAPADSATIALSVVVENMGHGGTVAAPIAKKILETYFSKFPLDPGRFAQAEKQP